MEAALRLVTRLAHYWLRRGLLHEGRRWARAALAHAGPVAPLVRVRALHAAGLLAHAQAEGTTGGLFGLVDAVAGQLLGGLSGGPYEQLTRVAATVM